MGSFDLALVYIGVVALIGALSYLVIVGPLNRLEIRGDERAVDAEPVLPRDVGTARA